MSRDKVEHALIYRATPLLLIVVIPILVALYVAQQRNAEMRRDAQVEACHRGNRIRVVPTETIAYLIGVSERAATLTTVSPDLRDYFRATLPALRAIQRESRPIDCQKVVG